MYAFDGFEKDLHEELLLDGRSLHSRQGRLFIVNGAVPSRPVWAQTMGPASKHRFDSISQGAKLLRSLGKRWACASTELHRRSSLIQEQLPRFRTKPLKFLGELSTEPFGAWALIEEKTMIAAPVTDSVFPLGEIQFEEDSNPPSRAYLKLWEVFTVHGIRPRQGERTIDFGSSPGGWTWVLHEIGCHVLSVDRADLDPRLRSPRIDHRRQDAFKLEPSAVGKVDWLFSDLICYPDRLHELVETWAKAGVSKMVCTIKFQGPTDFAAMKRFAAWPGSRIVHLCANKHEVTWIWLGK